MSLPESQPNNPLHGVKLAQLLEELVDYYGWEHMAFKVNINCFKNDPSIKSRKFNQHGYQYHVFIVLSKNRKAQETRPGRALRRSGSALFELV